MQQIQGVEGVFRKGVTCFLEWKKDTKKGRRKKA